MNKLLLAIAFVAAVSTSALAAYENPQGRSAEQRHVESASDHQGRAPHSQGGSARGEAVDPYWTPCDYSNDYTTDSCE